MRSDAHFSRCFERRDPLGELKPIVRFREEALDLAQQSMHRVWWDVRSAVHDLTVLGEDGGRRPAAHVVASVHIGPAIVVDPNRDKSLVDQVDDRIGGVRRLVHDVTPMTPHRGNREQDRLRLITRFVKRFIAPLAPADRTGAVRARRKMEVCQRASSLRGLRGRRVRDGGAFYLAKL